MRNIHESIFNFQEVKIVRNFFSKVIAFTLSVITFRSCNQNGFASIGVVNQMETLFR